MKLDEFRSSIKDPLIATLEKCQTVAVRANAISISAKPLAEMAEEIEKVNQEFLAELSHLQTRLIDADESEFSASGDWTSGFDEFEDIVLQAFDKVRDESLSDGDRRSALRSFKSSMIYFRKQKRAKISEEIKEITGII